MSALWSAWYHILGIADVPLACEDRNPVLTDEANGLIDCSLALYMTSPCVYNGIIASFFNMW